MKNYLRIAAALSVLAVLAITATSFSPGPSGSYYGYRPYFMQRSELESSVSYETSGRDLVNPGKIYTKPPYIYVNEQYKGVHVIDNTDPRSPSRVGFIVAPGCMDIAVKDDIMYLDNAVDLVAFDLVQRRVTERIRNVFPEHTSPNGDRYYGYSDEGLILVGWMNTDE